MAIVHSAELACRSPPRLSRWRSCLPEEAPTGLAPHSAAKLASLRTRPGLSPAVASSVAATWVDGMAGDRAVEAHLGLIQPEAVLAELEALLGRPPQPGGADQPGLAHRLATGNVAIVIGQLTAGQVAADQQVVAGAGRGYQGPGIPALALGALARGADLPAACALQQLGDGLRARHGDTARQREAEGGGNPQHIALAGLFAELPQFGAGAVDLVAADEVQHGPAGECLGEKVD